MKKLLLSLMLLASSSLLYAQVPETLKQEREARRTAREEAYQASVLKAIESKNFTFIAQSLQSPSGNAQFIEPTQNYVTIYPKFMDVVLPSPGNSWYVNSAYNLNLYVNNFTYNYYVADGYAHIQVVFENAMGAQPENFSRNFSYTFAFSINLISGSATLVVNPTYSAPVSYWGNFQLN